jgi:APA family basic amino acid/polyamine antiporter
MFAAACGNVGSSIYYALGVTAAFALGLTPIAFVISGFISKRVPHQQFWRRSG